jgi:hypothetical protein
LWLQNQNFPKKGCTEKDVIARRPVNFEGWRALIKISFKSGPKVRTEPLMCVDRSKFMSVRLQIRVCRVPVCACARKCCCFVQNQLLGLQIHPPSSKKQDFMHQNRPSLVAIVALKSSFAQKRVHGKRCDCQEASKFRGLARTD